MMQGLFQSFQSETTCFQAGENEFQEKEEEEEEEGLKVPLFHGCVLRYFKQPTGGADPASVGVCRLLVLTLNTKEEEKELVVRAFGEEHSVKTALHASF